MTRPSPLNDILAAPASELRPIVEQFAADTEALRRRFDFAPSTRRLVRLTAHLGSWSEALEQIDDTALGVEGRIDLELLRHHVCHGRVALEEEQRRIAAIASLLPFLPLVEEIHESRRDLEIPAPTTAAHRWHTLTTAIQAADAELRGAVAEGLPPAGSLCARALRVLQQCLTVLRSYQSHFAGYDPAYRWWTASAFVELEAAFHAYEQRLREDGCGIRDGVEAPILGDPLGRPALEADLSREMIPYSPEELIALADAEYAWCLEQIQVAAAELGFGADWRAALEMVKSRYVAPGGQPELVRDLAREAEAFLADRDLVSVPPLATEVWRLEMMTAEEQRVSPFFLGGEVIKVSFPTDTMSHPDRLMSLRGNNRHFARATVQHELIPGHHLQGYMLARWHPHRRLFGTPFWIEGWAIHWEMRLWNLGFPQSPEDRIGMLFWRMHRCARVNFSLRFHLGEISAADCVEYLVEHVGHERANAVGEIRRSFGGDYPPLYQAAYLIGGLQFRALYRELVVDGALSDREFHDAVLRGNQMPLAVVRARLLGQQTIERNWRFGGAG